MPQYDICLSTRADRTLDEMSPATRERVTETLQDVAEREQPTAHPDVEHLRANRQGKLRLRVGDWRLILELDKPDLLVHAVGDRETIYDND